MRNTVKKGLTRTAFAVAAGGALAGAALALPAAPLVIAGAAAAPAAGLGVIVATERISARIWRTGRGWRRRGVPLTEGEIALVKSVFGDSLSEGDLRRVRKYLIPEKLPDHPRTSAYAHGPRRIDFYTARYHEEDYSRPKSSFNLGLFLHEMTHLWQAQRQTPFTWQYLTRPRVYPYTLTENSKLTKFGTEQQAAIVEDYARRFLLRAPEYARNAQNGNSLETDRLLQKVVEEQFPQAKKTRLRIAREKQARLKGKPSALQ
jgi:hypothetical protein